MKANLFFLIFIFNTFFCFGQQSPTIKKVEIYALKFMTNYLIAIDKKDLKKMKPLYVRVVNTEEIEDANIFGLVTNLKKSDSIQLPDDYRAMFILHYSNSKKYTYYIEAGPGEIVCDNKLYDVNYPLIAAIYSFLPDDYFTCFYKKNPEVFK